jgi:hypothetical protein
MSKMVERVAIAIQSEHADMTGTRLSSEYARRYARRAIEAMRDATGVELDPGYDAAEDVNFWNTGPVWRAIIDAALKG